MATEGGEDVYIIPHNFTDNGKILGIIEIQSLYLAIGWFLPMIFINFWVLSFNLDIKIMTFIIIVIPPTIFALVGVGSDTLPDFLKYIYKFLTSAKCYSYER